MRKLNLLNKIHKFGLRQDVIELGVKNHISCEYEGYSQTGNPIFALNAFTHSTKNGYYPPVWAMKVFQENFYHHDYLFADPSLLFDKVLGITGEDKRSYKAYLARRLVLHHMLLIKFLTFSKIPMIQVAKQALTYSRKIDTYCKYNDEVTYLRYYREDIKNLELFKDAIHIAERICDQPELAQEFLERYEINNPQHY
jgi:hypothetical protein